MKGNISLSLDNNVLSKLNETNEKKSEIVNMILKINLMGEEGIRNEINMHKEKIALLEERLKNYRDKKKKEMKRINKMYGKEIEREREVLSKNPSYLRLRLKLFNENHSTCLNEAEFKEIMGLKDGKI